MNKNKWVECNQEDCKNISPNIKKFNNRSQVLSANSIALLKIIK